MAGILKGVYLDALDLQRKEKEVTGSRENKRFVIRARKGGEEENQISNVRAPTVSFSFSLL